jgi:hypothetical protein
MNNKHMRRRKRNVAKESKDGRKEDRKEERKEGRK